MTGHEVSKSKEKDPPPPYQPEDVETYFNTNKVTVPDDDTVRLNYEECKKVLINLILAKIQLSQALGFHRSWFSHVHSVLRSW